MSFEHHECTAADGSRLIAYDTGMPTIVVMIEDVSSFKDGVHHARIELPVAQLRELFNVGFSAEPIRTWCCHTLITEPHVSGCNHEPREDNAPDYRDLLRATELER